ncbi:MAG: formylglycine-generating enzyme family protein [Lentisphaerae bacterium]|nr:formylglycine-generating enzyme family protein [Lentisphaerota bacterium]
MVPVLLLAGSALAGENDPSARFRGPLTYDFAVTNVKWEAATPEYSYVTFDLHWSYSWRVKWTEPAKTSATGKDMEVENWDAAWVFVKFLPEKDTKAAIERNHWRHATLDTDFAHHVMPAGVTNTVGLTMDGKRGLGVYLFRDRIGHGVNDWKGIKLRWNHGTDQVDPAKAKVKAHAIAMVYVPEGPFRVGSGSATHIPEFLDGPTLPVSGTRGYPTASLTDGSWRGGPVIPFLLDAEWSGPASPEGFAAASPAKDGSRARRIGPVAGQLWGTLTYIERMFPGSSVGRAGVLNDEYPTGYEAFHFMKYPLTQGQYADFLNSLPPDVAAARAYSEKVDGRDPEGGSAGTEHVKLNLGPGYQPVIQEPDGHTIYSSADLPERPASLDDAGSTPGKGPGDGMDTLLTDVLDGAKEKKPQAPPVYTARVPFRRCNYLSTPDCFSYAVWAGLRPTTELEYEKACRGVRRPAPNELVFGSTNKLGQAGGGSNARLLDAGRPTERFAGGAANGNYFGAARVGWSATPDSDRETAAASYWGILELFDAHVISVGSANRKWRAFSGTPGDGRAPAGQAGAPATRKNGPVFDTTPADWPGPVQCGMKGVSLSGRDLDDRGWIGGEHMGGSRHAGNSCRLAGPRTTPCPVPRPGTADEAAGPPPSGRPAGPESAKAQAAPGASDTVKVTNIKWAAGTMEYSTVTFDLAWDNSWRAAWTEPAEANVTGKPLKLESWDAAWVFVKFRPAGVRDDAHATLAPDAGDHKVPEGATLDVGLSDDGERGVGAFIYRKNAGRGPMDLRNVSLRWQHAADKIEPSGARLTVHAIEVVYVPQGPFASQSPWGRPLTVISHDDATRPGGYAGNTNEIPREVSWPNGYAAFYCMKHAISQGQYAALLNSVASDPAAADYNGGRYSALANGNPRRYNGVLYNVNGFSIKYSADEKRYTADVPDRPCNMLSWPDILSYTAWAALRPPTCPEYEKACRGPRKVAEDGDAWTAATCAPAPALGLTGGRTYGSYGPSYWGIQGLSLSGNLLEWPGLVHNARRIGLSFSGSHGNGSPWAPDDWPWSGFGDGIGMGMFHGMGNIGIWVDPSALDAVHPRWENMDSDRTGRFGARAVRTAAGGSGKDAPLKVDALPNLAGYDLAIANLSGRFQNDGDQPLKVELVAALPADCFPQGPASRGFTAGPKTAAPFKVPVVFTSANVKAAVRRAGAMFLPLKIQGPGGEVLAEGSVRLQMETTERPPMVVQSLDGGKIDLNVKNATENPLTLMFEMSPPSAVRLGESKQSITIAAGSAGVVAFPAPRQWFPQEGPCRIPYRVTVGSGAALAGEAAVELRTQTRWWLTRRVKTGPKMGEGDVDLGGLEGAFSEAGDVFTLAAPSKGWKAVTCGSAVTLGDAGPLPSRESKAIGATRAIAPGDVNAVVEVRAVSAAGKEIPLNPTEKGEIPFFISVWVNDKLAFDSRLPEQGRAKPCRLRKGANALVVEWQSNADGETAGENVRVQFNDAKTGTPLPDLFFDMEEK